MKKKEACYSLVLVEHELDRENDIWGTFWNRILEIFLGSKYFHIGFLVKKKGKQYLFHSSMSHRDHSAGTWHTEINEYIGRSDVKSLKVIPLHKKNLKHYSKRKLSQVIKSLNKSYISIIGRKEIIEYNYFAIPSLKVLNIANMSKYNCGTFVNSVLRIDVLEQGVNYSLPSTYDKESIVDYVILTKSGESDIL